MKTKDKSKRQRRSAVTPASRDSVVEAITDGIMARHRKARSTPVQEQARNELHDESLDKMLASIATNAWRAERRMVDVETGEAREGMRLIHRDISAIRDALQQFGVETIDPAGRTYDAGLALKVVSFEPTPGISKEVIKETIKPSVRWQGRLIQMGEVIVGTPAAVEVTEEPKHE